MLSSLLLFGMFGFVPAAIAAPGDTGTLFFDDFEAANFAKWETPISPNWEVNFGSITGVYGADVEGNTDGNDAIRRSISTVGYDNLVLSYRFKADNLDTDAINHDEVRVQYSTNGGASWVTIYSIADGEDDHIDSTETGLYHKFHALPGAASNNANFAIRFDPDLVGGPDEVWVDDVMVTGREMGNTPPPPPPPTPTPTPPPSTESSYTACNDGVDNDNDGTTDVFDLGCLDFRQTVKIVTQVNGGTLSPSDFLMDVVLGTTVLSNDLSGSASGREVTRPEAGTWKIIVEPKAGYITSFSGECDASGAFTMGFNMYKTCTVTNTFNGGGTTPPPTPTPPPSGNESSYTECNDGIDNDNDGEKDVFDLGCLDFRQTVKIITKVQGGTANPFDFLMNVKFNANTQTLTYMGNETGTEITNPISGTWKLVPIAKAGYTPSFSGDCNASGEFAMGFNMYKTCTMTMVAQ